MKGSLGIVLLLQMYSLQATDYSYEETERLLPQPSKEISSKENYPPLLQIAVSDSDGCYYVPEDETKKDVSGGRAVVTGLSLVEVIRQNTSKMCALEYMVNQLRGENEQLSKRVIELEKQVSTITLEKI